MSRLMNFAGVLRLFKHIPWIKFICNWLFCNVQLLILWATGILVIVRCFSHRESFDKEIAAHLGSSFSQMPYIILVVCDSISCLSVYYILQIWCCIILQLLSILQFTEEFARGSHWYIGWLCDCKEMRLWGMLSFMYRLWPISFIYRTN
jgi:hypothetical protein